MLLKTLRSLSDVDPGRLEPGRLDGKIASLMSLIRSCLTGLPVYSICGSQDEVAAARCPATDGGIADVSGRIS